jgi:hypothetical protein
MWRTISEARGVALVLGFALAGCGNSPSTSPCDVYLLCLQDIVASGQPGTNAYQSMLVAAESQYQSCDASPTVRASCNATCLSALADAHAAFPRIVSCGATAPGPVIGHGGTDNVTACNNFLSAASCGAVNLSGQYNCDAFKAQTCDLSSYFDCLSKHYVCSNGTYDSSKLQSAGECAPMAVCSGSSGADLGSSKSSNPDLGTSDGGGCGLSTGLASCDSCINAACCAQDSACANNAQCTALVACISACSPSDMTCQQGCVTSHASGLAAFMTLTNCINNACTSACN